MTQPPYTLPSGRTLEEVAREADLSGEAMDLVDPVGSPTGAVEALLDAGQLADAVKLLALCLPPHAVIWWAWGCATQAHGDEPTPEVKNLLEATRAWIAEPSDPLRRRCFELADETGMGSPAGLAAVAVYLSSGSLAAPEVDPPVPPPEFGCGKVAGGSVLLGGALDPENAAERYRLFLKQGLEVARKAGAWPEPAQGGA